MSKANQQQAVDVAAQCFLNAMFRETSDWQYIASAAANKTGYIQVPLAENCYLHIDIKYFSATQHHQYYFPARLVTNDTEQQDLDFNQLVDCILSRPSITGCLPSATIEQFRQQVLASHQHTLQTIVQRSDWSALRDRPVNFAEAEQALLAGHAFHPAPKSHHPFTESEAKRYLPDYATRFPLHWFAVDKQYIKGKSLGLDLQQRLRRFAQQSAPQLMQFFTDDIWLLPMHPWQARFLLAEAFCQNLQTRGYLTDLGEAGLEWLPTSSCRSLYQPDCSDMIKFSLSVRLTNSVRTLSVKEVERGIRLARLSDTTDWQQLNNDFVHLQIMQEDAYAALCDAEGQIQQQSLIALRVNLLIEDSQQQTNVLVSLTQGAADGGDSLLACCIKRLSQRLNVTTSHGAHLWLEAYCQRVLLPLFQLQANYGIVLLAHQQNILVQMQQDLPTGLIYRDCQGSAYTELAANWLNKIGQPQPENLFSTAQVLRYFPYYLLLNSTLAVTAAMGQAGFADESDLLAVVKNQLQTLRGQVKDSRCLDYVLNASHWQCKGNFFCYLHDYNENTIVDPAIIYFNFVNPFAKEEQ